MRRRVVASIVGVTVVALLVLGVPLSFAIAHLYEGEAVLQLERTANEARSSVSTRDVVHGRAVRIRPDGSTHFGVYDAAGRRIGGSGPARADVATRSALGGDAADTRIGSRTVAAVPINGDGTVVGALRANGPADLVVDRTRHAWLVMLVIAAGAVAVATVLAWWQARRLTHPIDSLVDTAQRLGAGDLSARTESSGIDELDQLGDALDGTSARLGNLISRERAFSADASHQLRTPIAGLRVQVETALLEPEGDARAVLEDLLPPIDRLEATVDDLLRLARDTDVERVPLEIRSLVRDTEEHWHGRFAAQGRPLRVHVDEDVPAPTVAVPAVRQIIDVLIANAGRHGVGVVSISARGTTPPALVIEVRDEGSPPLDPRRIFERRSGRGHGVGLALARALAEAEGGRLVLEHTGPTVFALILPLDAFVSPSGPV